MIQAQNSAKDLLFFVKTAWEKGGGLSMIYRFFFTRVLGAEISGKLIIHSTKGVLPS